MIDPNHSQNLSVRSCAGRSRILLLQAALTAGLAIIQAGRVTAQTFRTLATNVQAFIVSGNTIYGITDASNGTNNTVVALNTDGTGLRTLYAFTPV